MLLEKVAGGDETAFAQLFNAHYNRLAEFIMRLTESEPLAQEIVQDVFMKIWINRRSLAEIDCFTAYLFVVARNHAFNCLKQIAREKSRKKQWVDTVLHQAVHNTENDAAADSICLIDQAVALLPARQKRVYTLSRRDGIRHEQIAKELNISLETVKKHMVLALRFLKNHLRTHHNFLFIFLAAVFSK